MTSTSAGPDVSVGPQSCLMRLVGLLLSWVSLVYRSSVFAVGRSRRFGESLILPGASCGSSSQLGVVGLQLLDVGVFFFFFLLLLYYICIITELLLSSSEYSSPEVGQPLTLYTRSSSNPRHRLLVSGNLSVSLEDRKYLRRIEQLQKFHVDW